MRSSSRSLRSTTAVVAVLALVLVGTVVGGCSAAPGASGTPGPAAAPVIAGAWVRPPIGMDRPAAGYMTITNPGGQADALVAASSSVATSIEVHETTTMSGMTGMQPVARIAILAGGTVKLEPGGCHLMLMGVQTLNVGDTVELVLTFEKAGRVTVKAEVKNG